MSDLPISSAATLDHSTIATGDLLPVVDISAATGSKGSKITVGELATTVNASLLGASNIFTASGAASTPALSLTGAVFTGGSSTTTKPLFLVEPSGISSDNWSSNGTLLGINIPSDFTGETLRFIREGTAYFRLEINSSGGTYIGSPGGGVCFYGTALFPETPGYLSLGWSGVSGWNGCYLTSGAALNWGSDAGLARTGASALKVTDGSTGYGFIDASGFKVSGSPGVDGTFTTADSKTVTVSKGVITDIA